MINQEGNVNFNIEALKTTIEKLTRALMEKDSKISQLQREGNMATISNTGSRIQKFEEFSGNDKEKQVVKLYAQGFSGGFIFDIMNKEIGVSVSMDMINSIVRSINGDKMAVSNDLLAYYVECKKVFEDQSTLSKGMFAQSVYKKMKILEENYSCCLVRAQEEDDAKEQRLILDSLLKLNEKTASIFSKQVLDIFNQDKGNGKSYSEEYKALKEKYTSNLDVNRKTIPILVKIDDE